MRRNGRLLVALVLALISYFVYLHHPAASRIAASRMAHQSIFNDGEATNKTFAEAPLTKSQQASQRMLAAPARADLRARYDASTDLFGLYQELHERANAGDPGALTAQADIEMECSMFIASHGDRSDIPRGMQKRNPAIATKPWVDALLARTNARCQRFTKSDLGTFEQRHAQLVLAAHEGSPGAKAQLLSEMNTKQLPDDLFSATVKEIMASGDPDAIGRLASVMHKGVAGREQLFDVPSGSDSASYAYVLAACKLGMACGPNSQALANLCFNGVGCGYPSVDEAMKNALLPPAELIEVQKMAQEIIDHAGHH